MTLTASQFQVWYFVLSMRSEKSFAVIFIILLPRSQALCPSFVACPYINPQPLLSRSRADTLLKLPMWTEQSRTAFQSPYENIDIDSP
ncbi:hypothetical protein L228DRAFT_251784 [Xylona heveae TC161]|uniref:Uncharacterized protein n=1 Tax=Xylona heveae (strain CBS 132557 / TC161) TaxID=1328760 RepID=A0A164ZBW4_XYLHT|nr:hypothetical protein L228DRAFT_251784 [Xylona heveae TC161]KZF18910.1 hypothetical protein L228DRAFT_251784 [Xylona heveae TC161]